MSGWRKGGRRTAAAAIAVAASIVAFAPSRAAGPAVVDPTPSRQTLEDASTDDCARVSVVVQRCGPSSSIAPAAPVVPASDALSRSRAQTKAAFDERDRRARADALKGGPAAAANVADAPVGDAQRLGGVTVTGRAVDKPASVEEILQRDLAPAGVSPNGILSHYAPNGTRYDCIQKCVGPACCTEVRSMPNPAHDVSSLNGH